MGSIRLLLALIVVLAHSYGDVGVGSRNAVQLFYTISGFLMSYVLVEANSYRSIDAFYLNRFLRLYPTYFAVLLLTLAIFLQSGNSEVSSIFAAVPFGAKALLVTSNVIIFGQDWIYFLAVRAGHLTFAKMYNASTPAT